MRHAVWAIVLLSWMTTTMPSGATTAGATLRFATTCARCHEGECSGRLTFAREPQAAFDHIRRYAGPADDALARQLYATLERMKSDCSYPPLEGPDLGRMAGREELAVHLDPWSGHYFLSLGELPAGIHRLSLEVHGDGRLRVEVIDATFDPIIDRCLTPAGGPLQLLLGVEDSGRHYLRLRPRGRLTIDRLTLSPLP
jgi:hypothetical protein